MSDDLFAPPKKRSSARLTLLLVLALLASGGANYWLWQERQRAISDGKAAIGKLAAAEATAKDLTQRVQELEGESIALAEGKAPPARDAGTEADGPARPGGGHEAIAAVDGAKKTEPDAGAPKAAEAKAVKPGAAVKATAPEAEAKAKPDAEDADEGEAASQPEKKAAKPAKTKKRAKPARPAKAAKTAPAPRKKAGARPEPAAGEREL